MAVKTHCGSTQTSAGWDFSSKQLYLRPHLGPISHTVQNMLIHNLHLLLFFCIFLGSREESRKSPVSRFLVPAATRKCLAAVSSPEGALRLLSFTNGFIFHKSLRQNDSLHFFFSWVPSFSELLPGNGRTVFNSSKQSQM